MNVANGAILQLLDGLDVRGLVVPLQAHPDPQVLLLGLGGGGQHLPDTRGVDRDGLLHEDVLARLDGGFELQRAEARRRREDDQVDPTVDHLLEGVEPDELPLGGNVDPGGDLGAPFILDGGEAALDAVAKGVAHRDQLDLAGGAQRLGGRPGAATTATDQPDANQVIATGVGAGEGGGLGQQTGSDGGEGAALQKLPAGGGVVCLVLGHENETPEKRVRNDRSNAEAGLAHERGPARHSRPVSQERQLFRCPGPWPSTWPKSPPHHSLTTRRRNRANPTDPSQFPHAGCRGTPVA